MKPDDLLESIELFSKILDSVQRDKYWSVPVRKAALRVSSKLSTLLDEIQKYLKGETV